MALDRLVPSPDEDAAFGFDVSVNARTVRSNCIEFNKVVIRNAWLVRPKAAPQSIVGS